MSILQTLFVLVFGSRVSKRIMFQGLRGNRIKLFLSETIQHWSFKKQSRSAKLAANAGVAITQSSGTFTVWTRHILALCGIVSLLVSASLAFNKNWRAQLAQSMMPTSRSALDSFTETVEKTLPEMVGLHKQAAKGEYVSALLPISPSLTIPQTTEDSSREAAVADYIARRYRVANVVANHLVRGAFSIGREFKLDPLLILSVAAIESRFNPYAESDAGAQGLMQVMTRVHEDKYDALGGKKAAFDPWVNMRVGAQILRNCINRAGSLEGGLKLYVGAAPTNITGTTYGLRVLAERERMRKIVDELVTHVKQSPVFELAES